jgi:RimJ/RimL family protein N-acetyltransferase
MAAFVWGDPDDRAASDARWQRILANPAGTVRTVLVGGAVSGSVLSYEDEGRPEVSYWIGREHWGRGVATRALALFLADVEHRRPIFARAVTDNLGSLRVLERCGFVAIGGGRGLAPARGAEVDELLLELR